MLDTPTLRAELELNLVSAFLAIRHGAPLMRSGASIVCYPATEVGYEARTATQQWLRSLFRQGRMRG